MQIQGFVVNKDYLNGHKLSEGMVNGFIYYKEQDFYLTSTGWTLDKDTGELLGSIYFLVIPYEFLRVGCKDET